MCFVLPSTSYSGRGSSPSGVCSAHINKPRWGIFVLSADRTSQYEPKQIMSVCVSINAQCFRLFWFWLQSNHSIAGRVHVAIGGAESEMELIKSENTAAISRQALGFHFFTFLGRGGSVLCSVALDQGICNRMQEQFLKISRLPLQGRHE